MPPPEPPRADGFSDSDQAWYDRLGPSPRPPPTTAAEREGDALKEAMRIADEARLQRPEVQAALGDEARERRRQRLHARLDAEGLLMPQPPAATPAPRPPAWWQRLLDTVRGTFAGPRWPAVAGLAFVLALGSVVVVNMETSTVYQREPELKGMDDVRRLPAAQPRQAAEAFAAELRAAGLRPALYQRGRTFIVDIDVSREQFAAATPAFARIGLQTRLGYTRLEFEPAQAR